jgi:hypothetical protein
MRCAAAHRTALIVYCSQLRDGCCVVAFFRSGGIIAAQLGHHWHLVTPMDAQDVLDGVVRIAGVAYPQRAAIVSGTAVERQWDTCSAQSTHSLACELQCKAESEGETLSSKARGKRAKNPAKP